MPDEKPISETALPTPGSDENIASPSFISAHADHGVGVIQLNRPAALNALTLAMVSDIANVIDDWRHENLNALILTSSSPKAFCAGGDIRQIRSNTLAKKFDDTEEFFRTEYALNARIADSETPIVSIIDGICMGGGLGLSIHGQFRVVTEKAVLAMPENVIGFFPDIGASYFLARLPGALGMFIGMTGYRLDALDALYTGLATHYIDSVVAPMIPHTIRSNPSQPLDQALRSLGPDSKLGESTLARHRTVIDYCFGASDVDTITDRLKSQNTAWADKTLSSLEGASPQSLVVTHALISRGRQRNLKQCLDSELDIALSMSRSNDFVEGVRAGLVEKDRSPRWGAKQFDGFDLTGSSRWQNLE